MLITITRIIFYVIVLISPTFPASAQNNEEIVLKTSNFAAVLKERQAKVGAKDIPASAKLASEILKSEGLNHKVRLKNPSNKNWPVCVSHATSDQGCRQINVESDSGKDKCGAYSRFSVLSQSDGWWTVTNGSAKFVVKAKDVFDSESVILRKSETEIRTWSPPENFTPEYITPDLRAVYFKNGDLHLLIFETGLQQFLPLPKDLTGFTVITSKPVQPIKSAEGVLYQIQLPQKCN